MLWDLSSRAGARRACTQITLENEWKTTHFPIMLRAIKATKSMHDLDRPSRAILKTCYKTNVKSAFLQTPTPRTHRIWTSVSQTCPDLSAFSLARRNARSRLNNKWSLSINDTHMHMHIIFSVFSSQCTKVSVYIKSDQKRAARATARLRDSASSRKRRRPKLVPSAMRASRSDPPISKNRQQLEISRVGNNSGGSVWELPDIHAKRDGAIYIYIITITLQMITLLYKSACGHHQQQ